MKNTGFKLLAAAIVAVLSPTGVSSQDGACTACNCQFNNVQLLEGLIDDKIPRGIGKHWHVNKDA